MLIFALAFGYFAVAVNADTVNTSVNVSNDAPAFDVSPAENPVSDGTTPTNAGDNVTIEATATDPGGEDYYLIVCDTNAVTATNGGAPTCDSSQWCVSSATTSGNSTSCTFATNSGMAESNDWYAFVCDGNASNAQCSSADQGTGSSGSPFKVNHAPTFDTISNDGPADPGDDVIFSTSVTTTDGDTDTSSDTVRLLVCKTAGVSAGACDGGGSDTWCTGSLVASDPTCTATIDAVAEDGSQDAYVYVFDSHDFAASAGQQGQNSSFDINNVAPVVSSVTLNGGSDIALTEGTTTSITITATVTDNNSCQDLNTVVTSAYRSAITYAGCDTGGEADNNYCYANITCTEVVAGNTCDSATDGSVGYTCTVDLQYHADPTDAGTEYPTENWLTSVVATDIGALSDTTEVSTGVEVQTLVGYDVTAAINYGTLNVGESNDPLDRNTQVDNTGNSGLDVEVSGSDMTDGGTGTIAVGNQHYTLTPATAYASGTALTTTATEIEVNIPKTTVTAAPENDDLIWGLLIPGGTTAGTYTGTNNITAVLGEVVNW